MDTVCLFETSVFTYQSTRHHNPKHHHRYPCRCEHLTSYKLVTVCRTNIQEYETDISARIDTSWTTGDHFPVRKMIFPSVVTYRSARGRPTFCLIGSGVLCSAIMRPERKALNLLLLELRMHRAIPALTYWSLGRDA
jgi:hypothetical protein